MLPNIETPYYYYDIEGLTNHLDMILTLSKKYNINIHYALKANSNKRLLNVISSFGVGADCVSGNEIKRALKNGFRSKDIVFAGVGKKDNEINFALDHSISEINVESLDELHVIHQLAHKKGKITQVAIRINPGIDVKTHKHITTGAEYSKFGIQKEDIPEAISLLKTSEYLHFVGLHFHLGSQINSFGAYLLLCEVINKNVLLFEENSLIVRSINVGGGLGINYENPDENQYHIFDKFFRVFKYGIKDSERFQLKCELGRSIVGNFGEIVTSVLYKKPLNGHELLIVDASMTELIRPALYNAFHKIESFSNKESNKEYTIAGPICESSDIFGNKVLLPESSRGDLLRIRSCGAYAESMASNYNLRPIAKSYYSDLV